AFQQAGIDPLLVHFTRQRDTCDTAPDDAHCRFHVGIIFNASCVDKHSLSPFIMLPCRRLPALTPPLPPSAPSPFYAAGSLYPVPAYRGFCGPSTNGWGAASAYCTWRSLPSVYPYPTTPARMI